MSDLRMELLEKRKAKLAKPLAKADHGVRYNDYFEDEARSSLRTPAIFGLEALEQAGDFDCRSGTYKARVKLRNPVSPAMMRIGT